MLRDLPLAIRSLSKVPTFTLTAMVTLGLGIGTSTAGFGVLNAFFLRPMAGITDSRNLVQVSFGERNPQGGIRLSPLTSEQHGTLSASISALSRFAGYYPATLTVAQGDNTRRVDAEFVMPTYFAVLGTRPELGRLLAPDDDLPPNGSRVAVITHELWSTLFNRDSEVIGRTLRVNAALVTVVGVAEVGFYGAEGLRTVGVWLPGRTYSAVFSPVTGTAVPRTYYRFVGRLSEGSSLGQAREQLDAAGGHVIGKEAFLSRGPGPRLTVREMLENSTRTVLFATTLVLVVACANVAGLLVLRGIEGRREAAVRRVLGATTKDVLGQQLAESLVIVTASAAAGLGIAAILGAVFKQTSLVRGAPPLDGITLDLRVALYTSLIAGGAAVVCSMAPFVVSLSSRPIEAMREAARSHTPHARHLRAALTACQVSLSSAILVGALLLLRTLGILVRVDLGFEPDGVTIVRVSPAEQGYTGSKLQAYYGELMRGLRAVGGVEVVSLANNVPFSGGSGVIELTAGTTADAGVTVRAAYNTVSPEYFRTLQIPLVAGRTFAEHEFKASTPVPPRVLVLDRSLASVLFGDQGQGALGQELRLSGDDLPYQVIGVVADARWNTLTDVRESVDGGFVFYRAYHGRSTPRGYILVRSQLPYAETVSEIRRTGAQVDRAVPLFDAKSLRENIEEYLAERRLFAKVLMYLGGIGLLISAVGVHGLVAHGVLSRRRELGIRLALGAQSKQVVAVVISEAVAMTASGVALGMLPALWLARLLGSRVYGLSGGDPLTYITVATVLFSVAMLAAWAPARRATLVDPASSLRNE